MVMMMGDRVGGRGGRIQGCRHDDDDDERARACSCCSAVRSARIPRTLARSPRLDSIAQPTYIGKTGKEEAKGKEKENGGRFRGQERSSYPRREIWAV